MSLLSRLRYHGGPTLFRFFGLRLVGAVGSHTKTKGLQVHAKYGAGAARGRTFGYPLPPVHSRSGTLGRSASRVVVELFSVAAHPVEPRSFRPSIESWRSTPYRPIAGRTAPNEHQQSEIPPKRCSFAYVSSIVSSLRAEDAWENSENFPEVTLIPYHNFL